MPKRDHRYSVDVVWTGNRGSGTDGYRRYGREHEIRGESKAAIAGSADPAFLGDAMRWNPEELFVAALSACHKLWYLHLAADAGVIVIEYRDTAVGIMSEHDDGNAAFSEVVLRPRVVVSSASDPKIAAALHDEAHRRCFIARSVSCPVRHETQIVVAD